MMNCVRSYFKTHSAFRCGVYFYASISILLQKKGLGIRYLRSLLVIWRYEN